MHYDQNGRQIDFLSPLEAINQVNYPPGLRSGKECSMKRVAAREFKIVEGRSGASQTKPK